MAGGYDPNNPPVRAGFYSLIRAAAEAAATGGAGGIVAFPVHGDWGPVGVFKTSRNQSEYEAVYGTSDIDERVFMRDAFTGNGQEGNGAQELLTYRMPVTGQATAEKDFNNTTPAAAINIAAKYPGTKGNDITITFRDNPTDSAYDQMLVYVGGSLVETYTYLNTGIASLVQEANEKSNWVKLTLLVGTTAMAPVTGVSLTDTVGANGTPVLADYTDAMTVFESEAFNIFAIPNMTDSSILAALRSWCETQNATARRFMIVTGGAAGETFSAAINRSALSPENENVVNCGYNSFISPDNVIYSSAEIVGFLCGMIAGAGSKRSITFDRLPAGWSLAVTPSIDDINEAINNGLVIFSKDANGVKVEKGVTTFVNSVDPDKPLEDFSKIKSVRTIHQIENDLTQITELEWIGKVPNTPQSRDGYIGALLSYLKTLEDQSIIQNGSSAVRLDETQDNTGDTLYPIYSIAIVDAIERVLSIGELA